MVAVGPPLGVDGVAIERAPTCAPLCSAGVTPPRRSYGGIRLPMDRWVAFHWAGCGILPPSVEESIGPPEFPTLPCARATVFDPGGFAEAMAVGLSDRAFHVSQHVGTHSSSHNGAQSLHACALRPVHSLCTLRWRRYRRQRNTRYPVPGQGFRGQALPLTGNAELCSAHVKTRNFVRQTVWPYLIGA